MVKFDEGKRVNKRGLQHRYISCLPEDGQPKAVFVWNHGYGEHVGRYKEFFTELAQAGIAVYAQDHIAHGLSDLTGPDDKCLIWDFQDMISDAEEYGAEVRAKHPGLPAFVAGQSMGGLIAATMVLHEQDQWSGLILCSAAIDVEWTFTLRCQAPIGGLLATLLPRARIVPAVKLEDLCPLEEVRKSIEEDPLNFVGNVRARTANELLKGFRAMQQRESELKLPIYAVHGTNDRTTSLTAVKRLLKSSQSSDVTLQCIEGGYHSLLLGPEKGDVFEGMIAWMLQHVN